MNKDEFGILNYLIVMNIICFPSFLICEILFKATGLEIFYMLYGVFLILSFLFFMALLSMLVCEKRVGA